MVQGFGDPAAIVTFSHWNQKDWSRMIEVIRRLALVVQIHNRRIGQTFGPSPLPFLFRFCFSKYLADALDVPETMNQFVKILISLQLRAYVAAASSK